jgi:rRNA methylases
MMEISSKTNDHFRRWTDLSTARGIKKHQEFFLMGEKLIEEFLKNPAYKVKAEIINEDLKSVTAGNAKLGRVPLFKLSKALFNELDTVGTHYNLLVLEPKELGTLEAKTEPKGLELICPLGDPGNLGAIARSAVAFGVSKIILTEEACTPYHPKAIKASAGALLNIPLYKVSKLADFAVNSPKAYALDMKGEDVARFPWPKDLRLVVGEEGPGFGDIKGLSRLSVPTASVESLNATVAASIALYSWNKAHSR